MGRKSKLSDAQWEGIRTRILEEEPVRAIARDVGVSEAAIRKRFGTQVEKIKSVAKQIVDTEAALQELPIGARISAQTLASKLRSISSNLASAAENGAVTAKHLSGIARAEAEKVDPAKLQDAGETLKGVAVLTRMANDASEIPLNLLNANKDRMKGLDETPPETGPLPADPVEAARVYKKLISGG